MSSSITKKGTGTRFLWALVAISALAAVVALPAGSALAKRMVGTNGPDRIVGTNKADRINARAGNDRINGSRGNDRLVGGKGSDRLIRGPGKDRIKGGKGKDQILGGKGADRLNAVDRRKDLAVNGGPGKDVCVVDKADLPVLKNCERAKVMNGGHGDGLRITSASGLTCASALPLCPFQIAGDRADSSVGSVSGDGGVSLAVGAAVSTTGEDWTAAGLYGCSANGHLMVTIGSKSVRVPITCTG